MKFHPVGVAGALAFVFALTLAIAVIATGPGARRDRLLALVLIIEGTAFGCGGGFIYFTTSTTVVYYLQAVFITGIIALPFSYLALIGTLPTPLAKPLRGRGAHLVLALLAALAEAYWLTHRAKFIGGVVPAWYATWDCDLPPAAVAAMNLVGAVGVVSLLVALSAYRRAARGTAARRQARGFVIAFGVHDVGQFVFTLVLPGHIVPPPPSGRVSDLVIIIGSSGTTLAFVVLLAYGILKLQLFDIDLRVKRGLRRSTVAAAFIAVFLVVEQLTQNYFASEFGLVFGAIAAGLMLFGLSPLRHFAEKVASGAMPNVSASPDYVAYRKLEVYRAAYESLLESEGVSAKERLMLDRLRGKLGILPSDAAAIESDVRNENKAAIDSRHALEQAS